MADDTPKIIDATLWGYIKPILMAAVTRGLLALSAYLTAHGIVVGTPTESQAAAVLAGLIGVAMWAWGPVKAFVDHRLKAQLADAAPDTKALVKK